MKSHLLFAATLLAALAPAQSRACSCAPPLPVEEARERAVRVFRGEVIAIERREPFNQRVTFRVSEHFKGSPVETLQVDSPLHGPSCGYPFMEGGDYVVYAHGHEGSLATNSCSRTTLAVRGSDLEALRAAD